MNSKNNIERHLFIRFMNQNRQLLRLPNAYNAILFVLGLKLAMEMYLISAVLFKVNHTKRIWLPIELLSQALAPKPFPIHAKPFSNAYPAFF